jgi:hypothetical protein
MWTTVSNCVVDNRLLLPIKLCLGVTLSPTTFIMVLQWTVRAALYSWRVKWKIYEPRYSSDEFKWFLGNSSSCSDEYTPLAANIGSIWHYPTCLLLIERIVNICGIVVAEALLYKTDGRGLNCRWGHSIVPIYLILLTALGRVVYSASNRNEYQKPKKMFQGSKARLVLSQPYRPPWPIKGDKRASVALVRERTIPIERPPLVGKISANFCW